MSRDNIMQQLAFPHIAISERIAAPRSYRATVQALLADDPNRRCLGELLIKIESLPQYYAVIILLHQTLLLPERRCHLTKSTDVSNYWMSMIAQLLATLRSLIDMFFAMVSMPNRFYTQVFPVNGRFAVTAARMRAQKR